MNKELVFVHGRAQEHKDAATLKGEWVAALEAGLLANGLTLPISADRIRFPYYGQTLFDLANDGDDVADVIVRGDGDENSGEFLRTMLAEVLRKSSEDSSKEDLLIERGARARLTDRGWVRQALRLIDDKVPYASAAGVAIATEDVYQYLTNPGIRDTIEAGVRGTMRGGVASVVVSHSLGTVVAYQLLRREGAALGWKVPLFVTLGSPLAVSIVSKRLRPLTYPACVGHWFNALDERDIVALYPLEFSFKPEVENWNKVENETVNRHGISGYLSDPVVAKRIHDALVS